MFLIMWKLESFLPKFPAESLPLNCSVLSNFIKRGCAQICYVCVTWIHSNM